MGENQQERRSSSVSSLPVAVIGGGPAGLSAAQALIERGYQVVVFEKEKRLGGKCRSFVYRGTPYDLGANLVSGRYTHVRDMAAELGMTFRNMRRIRTVNLNAPRAPRGEVKRRKKNPSALTRLAARSGQYYYEVLRNFSGIEHEGYVDAAAELSMPFGDWLQKKGLGVARDMFAQLFIAYGYGLMDRLPAAYAMKFFDAYHLRAATSVALNQPAADTQDFVEGFQELWLRAAAASGIDARCGVAITSISRRPDRVVIEYVQQGKARLQSFSHVVLACPLDATLMFLDASPEERHLFGKIRYQDYFVTMAQVEGVPDRGTYLKPYCRTLQPGQPTCFYPAVARDPNQIKTFYAYGGDDVDIEDIHRNIETAIEHPRTGDGGRVKRILYTHRWRYFPHVSSEDMSNGFYADLDRLQGRHRTYYVGELLSFALVELVARHAHHIVDQHFCRPAVQLPRRLPSLKLVRPEPFEAHGMGS